MENLLFLVIGALLMYLILQKPLRIEVHHKNETIIPKQTEENMAELEEKMFKQDPKSDKNYDELDNVDDILTQAREIMGGSDR